MTTPRPKVLLSWSTGKDSAWALHVLRQRPDLEVVGLLTTFNEVFDRVAMHAVRRELVEAQAAAAGLPLIHVMLPLPCTNEREGFGFADLRPAEIACIETEGSVS
jgi:diphthamide synthase (EF-2-diphthine--ammonia ligase)